MFILTGFHLFKQSLPWSFEWCFWIAPVYLEAKCFSVTLVCWHFCLLDPSIFLYCVICTGVIYWRISHFRMLFTHINECWKETKYLAKLLQLLGNMKSIHPLKFALKVKHFTHLWDSVNETKLKLRLPPFSVVHLWCQHAFCFQFYHIFHSLTWINTAMCRQHDQPC